MPPTIGTKAQLIFELTHTAPRGAAHCLDIANRLKETNTALWTDPTTREARQDGPTNTIEESE